MQRVLIGLSITLSIAAFGADKDKRFAPKPASSYATKQSQGKVVVAAVPYVDEDENRDVFGKTNPYKAGVLPVLVVIENGSNEALRLDLKVEYINGRNRHIESISPRDIFAAGPGPKRPKIGGSAPPIPLPKKKNQLGSAEIAGLAFAARMVPAGESVHGFFYFNTELDPSAQLYLTGVSEARSGKELFYFEIPLAQ
jgi:hypothetical protein